MVQVTPANESHAIEMVAIAFKYNRQLNPNDIEAIKKSYSQSDIKRLLPRVQPVHKMEVSLEAGTQIPKARIAGIKFDCINGGKPEWEVMFREEEIVLICRNYTRWEEFKEKSIDYIEKLCADIDDLIIEQIVFECRDRFNISKFSDGWQDQLLNRASDFLPKNVFSTNLPWHSHHGFFDIKNNLHKINLDAVLSDEEDQPNFVLIHSQHVTREFPVSNILFMCNGKLNLDIIKILDFHHEKNKEFLKSLLIEKILNRISLR